jgi:transketolase
VSAERLVAVAAAYDGMAYIRTSRPKTEVIYTPADLFEVGGSKVLYESPDDVATVVAAGVTVFEACAAYDELLKAGIAIRVIDAYSVQPIDTASLVRAGRKTGRRIITVEDHYPVGGLGDAVSEAVAEHGITVRRLAVREVPRSGQPRELLDRYGISASHIAAAVRQQVEAMTEATAGGA